MYNLSAFRNQVRELCRRGSPYDDERRPGLADLASAIGLSRGELSYRLNGTNNAKLTTQDVRAIVRTLTEWGALSTRAEAIELMALVDCPPPIAAEWEVPPLNQLAAPQPIATAATSVSRASKVEQRVEVVRPIAHQPEMSRLAVGRARELSQLAALLDTYTCVAITGIGGMGKSTFAAMYATTAHYPSWCWRNLHHNPSFADFVQAAMSSLGLYFDVSVMPRPQDQANYLASILRGHSEIRQLIVLNNFESVINQEEVDPGWQELLELAIAGLGESRVLLTTRDLPYTRQGREPYRFALGGLNLPDGVALLEKLGVEASSAELEQAVKLAGGHPLALVFMADLSHNHGYTVAELLGETAWNERIALRFLDKIYKQLAPSARATLTYFSVFDAPTRAAAVAGMLAQLPASVSPPTHSWDEAQVRRYADELVNRSLLDSRASYYQLHPLIREYAHNHLRDKADHHNAAAMYFQSLYTHDPDTDPPQRLPDVQPLLDAFDQFCAAANYGAAYELALRGLEHLPGGMYAHLAVLLLRWGEFARAAAIYKRLADAPTGSLDVGQRSLALNNLGIAYRNLGRYEDAIACYEQGLTLAQQAGDTRTQAHHLANLAVAYEKLKDYSRAIHYNQEVLALAEPAGYIHSQSVAWTSLGNTYLALGDYAQSLAAHQHAFAISEQQGDRSGMVTDLINLGEVSFKLGQRLAGVQYYQRGMTLALEIGHVDGVGLVWQLLGNAFTESGHGLEALTCYLRALPIREQLGNPDDIETTHTAVARLRNSVSAEQWETLAGAAERQSANADWQPWDVAI